MLAVALRVNTTGESLSQHALAELGACAVSLPDGKVQKTFQRLFLIPRDRGWSVSCVRNYWDLSPSLSKKRARIESVGLGTDAESPVEPSIGMKAFVDWLQDDILRDLANNKPENVVLLSATPLLDCGWINLYLDLFTKDTPPLPWNFRDVVCTTSYSQGHSGITYEQARVVADLSVGAEAPSGAVSPEYDALTDATHIAQRHVLCMYGTKKRRRCQSVEGAGERAKKLARRSP